MKQFFTRLYYKVYFFITDLQYLPENIYNSLSNLYFFFNCIVNWRSWDYHYSLVVMNRLFKKHYKEVTRYNKYCEPSEEHIVTLQRLIEISNRLISDNYFELAGIRYDDVTHKFIPIEGSTSSAIELEFHNGYTEEEYRKHIEESHRLEQADWEQLGKLMSKFYNVWN